MKKGKILVSLFLTFLISPISSAEQKGRSISLEECILHALKNNLGVAVGVLNPELADIDVAGAREKFMPGLDFEFLKRETNAASYSWIEAAESVHTLYSSYSATLSQLMPGGGKVSLSLDSYKNDTNMKFQTINPVFRSTLNFNFTQPLLKDFGYKVSRKEIIIAKNNMEISEIDLKKTLLDTIYSVEEAYWNLVNSIENLKVRRQSLELARDLLRKNQKEVEIGTLAPKEILSAQAEVASREAEILQAEATVKNNTDLLKTIINLPDEEEATELVPVDKPSFEKRDVELEGAFRTAIENRPDLQSQRIRLKNREVELSFAKNQLLPALNLNANFWSPGVSGTRIVYFENNPLTGIVVETVPGGISNSLNDAFGLLYKNWSVYLTLEIPLNTIISRAAHARAKVSMEQEELRLKQQEQQTFLEIKSAVRAVETDYMSVQAYKIARELAEEKLEAEESKLKAGLSTNYIVLQYQRDLVRASTDELRAIIDYNLSLSKLDRALGITLERKNIRLSDVR